LQAPELFKRGWGTHENHWEIFILKWNKQATYHRKPHFHFHSKNRKVQGYSNPFPSQKSSTENSV
jgi:hypothetical protein